MCMIDGCDGYWARVTVTNPVARKNHKCDECYRVISAGEPYHRTRGLSVMEGERDWVDFKMCIHCHAAAQWLVLNCNGYVMDFVREDLEEHFREAHVFPPGHAVWLGRAVIGMRRKWKGLPIPQPAQKMDSEQQAAA